MNKPKRNLSHSHSLMNFVLLGCSIMAALVLGAASSLLSSPLWVGLLAATSSALSTVLLHHVITPSLHQPAPPSAHAPVSALPGRALSVSREVMPSPMRHLTPPHAASAPSLDALLGEPAPGPAPREVAAELERTEPLALAQLPLHEEVTAPHEFLADPAPTPARPEEMATFKMEHIMPQESAPEGSTLTSMEDVRFDETENELDALTAPSPQPELVARERHEALATRPFSTPLPLLDASQRSTQPIEDMPALLSQMLSRSPHPTDTDTTTRIEHTGALMSQLERELSMEREQQPTQQLDWSEHGGMPE